MSGMYGSKYGLTSGGWRGGKRVWRVTWDERPGMVADVTGPDGVWSAFLKLTTEGVLERLPWTKRS